MRLAFFAAVALALGSVHCGVDAFARGDSEEPEERERGSTASNQFFENALRRDASAVEASRVARVGGCAAFFLENSAGRTYVMSAQHCFRFDAAGWCAQTKGSAGVVTENDGTSGRCARVVVADPHRDLVVFEVTNEHAREGESTLRLAAYVPPPETRLVMVGYPGDRDPEDARRGRLTTTEDCWTLGAVTSSPHADTRLRDRSVRHNCSTYGGNSGGPMWIEGTRDVVGLPFTYVPNDYERRGEDALGTAASLALTADFVFAHRAELEAAGIAIVDADESAGGLPYVPLPGGPAKPAAGADVDADEDADADADADADTGVSSEAGAGPVKPRR